MLEFCRRFADLQICKVKLIKTRTSQLFYITTDCYNLFFCCSFDLLLGNPPTCYTLSINRDVSAQNEAFPIFQGTHICIPHTISKH
jgi:hypothetical protein